MSANWVTNILRKLKKSTRAVPPLPKAAFRDPLYFIAFGFGTGAIPFAPGTFGTLAAIPFYLLFRLLPLDLYLALVLLLIPFTSWLCEKVSREIHAHDHPGMCIDEFVGFFVTMINAPFGFWWIVLGFMLFRLFDIWKPWPIRWVDQHIQNGFGMILDDVLAGVYGFVILQLYQLCAG